MNNLISRCKNQKGEWAKQRKCESKIESDSNRAYYQLHPLEYFRDVLGVNLSTIDWEQNSEYKNHKWDGTRNPFIKILNALLNNKWCGVESGTGTGKTFFGALTVLWFLENFENSLVVTTAPKKDQLTLHIWREIGKLYPKFNKGELTTLKLRMIPEYDDWLAVGFVAGVKADEESSTKAQGFHAEHMLIIFEETPGIPEPVMTAFQNTSVGTHNLILAFGNPDHQLDNLHRFCMQNNVEHIRISGHDHPNVVKKDSSFIPGAQSVEGLTKMLDRYGSKDHPLYLSRARGISPKQSVDALIKTEWCYNAVERYKNLFSLNDGANNINHQNNNLTIRQTNNLTVKQFIKGIPALGVDVANSEAGDKAAVCEGMGNVCLSVEDFRCDDSNQLGKREIYMRMKNKNILPEYVGVDGIGVGAGTVNALKEMGMRIVSLIGSEAPVAHRGEEEFNNLRSQMWWEAREALRRNEIDIVHDEELIADLTSPRWMIQNGKIVVESKEKIRERLGRSPNKGDAFVYWNWVRNGKRRGKVTSSLI